MYPRDGGSQHVADTFAQITVTKVVMITLSPLEREVV